MNMWLCSGLENHIHLIWIWGCCTQLLLKTFTVEVVYTIRSTNHIAQASNKGRAFWGGCACYLQCFNLPTLVILSKESSDRWQIRLSGSHVISDKCFKVLHLKSFVVLQWHWCPGEELGSVLLLLNSILRSVTLCLPLLGHTGCVGDVPCGFESLTHDSSTLEATRDAKKWVLSYLCVWRCITCSVHSPVATTGFAHPNLHHVLLRVQCGRAISLLLHKRTTVCLVITFRAVSLLIEWNPTGQICSCLLVEVAQHHVTAQVLGRGVHANNVRPQNLYIMVVTGSRVFVQKTQHGCLQWNCQRWICRLLRFKSALVDPNFTFAVAVLFLVVCCCRLCSAKCAALFMFF